MKYDVSRIRNPEIRDLMAAYLFDIEMRTYGVKTYAALVAALADTTITNIYLLNDITLEGMLAFSRRVELDGQGYKLSDATLDANQYIAAQISAEYVSIYNVDWHISGNSDANTLYSIDVGAANSRIYDCEYTMANAGSSGSVSVYYEGYLGHVLNDNTASNGVAITGGAAFSEIKNNAFAATKGFGLGVCTIGGVVHTVASPADVTAIKAFLTAEGNTTTGGTLVVEDYL